MDLSHALKRFYKTVTIEENDDGYCILLDQRQLKSPAKRALVLPSEGLAEEIAKEWDEQGDHILPVTMPLMALASTTVDRISQQRAGVVHQMVRYGETDLICYWTDDPEELMARQKETWLPYLEWAREDLGITLNVQKGIMHKEQPAQSLETIQALIDERDDWSLAALSSATYCTGSIIIGLAFVMGRINAEDAFVASQVDETYQIEQWGEDWEAKDRRDAIRKDLESITTFLSKL